MPETAWGGMICPAAAVFFSSRRSGRRAMEPEVTTMTSCPRRRRAKRSAARLSSQLVRISPFASTSRAEPTLTVRRFASRGALMR